ncbi:hypothetical protein MMC26_004925 [Xylographa opegraphella]|nr:hypothetical protein [Xylographa opegraphella]
MLQQSSYDYPPPPPPQEMPPLPHDPPPPTGAYQFGGYGQSHDISASHPQSFSFTPNISAPQYPREADTYRPSPAGQDNSGLRRRPNRRAPQRNGNQQYAVDRGQRDNRRPFRGRGNKHYATADRPLLQLQRDGSTPERMIGMNDHERAENRFLDVDDMSDSVEEAMDESDQDEYEPTLNPTLANHGNAAVEEEGNEITKMTCDGKLDIDDVPETTKIADSIPPKWSNPEYYTALPPPDESQRKKKDVIKFIRKARVAVEKTSNMHSQVATNDDFISFGAEEDTVKDLDRNSNVGSSLSDVRDVTVHSTAKSSAFHQPLYSTFHTHAPGTYGQTLSSDALGPPPSKAFGLNGNTPGTAAEVLEGNSKRKRSVEILETEPLRAPKRKKGISRFTNGHVLDEWVSPKPSNPIPWVVRDHRMTRLSGFRLHKEVIDFYEFVKPQEHEQVVRRELLERLQNAIRSWRADLELHSFGSFAAGLYLPTADMDLVVLSKDFRDHGRPNVCQTNNQMRKLADYLEKNGIAEPWSVEIVGSAKVPLIKFVDHITQLKIDMSFENDTGLVANNTFRLWKALYPAMPIIVTTIKQFLLMRGLNEVANGGLGGFSVTCLVVSLLQNMPRVQTGEIVPEQNLGEILLEFLDLYGNQFEIARTGIRMEPPGYFDKRTWNSHKPLKPDRLAIMDPNQKGNDISGGSRNVMLIFARFSRARAEILDAMENTNRASLLDWMLGGNYNTFLWQRARLRNLYGHQQGNLGPEDAGSHSKSQGRGELVQITNGEVRPEHQSVVGSPIQNSEASNPISIPKKPGTEQGTVVFSSRGRMEPGPKKAHRKPALTTKTRAHMDPNSTTKSKLTAMLQDATRAYGHLTNPLRIEAQIQGDYQTFKSDKELKAARREASELILRLRKQLARLDKSAKDVSGPLPSSQKLVRNNTILPNVLPVASSNDVSKNAASQRAEQSHIDESSFTSRAPKRTMNWVAERRPFLFQKQYLDAAEVSKQPSPVASKELTDRHDGITFIREVSKHKAGGKTTKQAEHTASNNIGGTSQADAIMID